MKENALYDKKSLRALTCKNPDWREIVKDCVAFANAEGGIIEYGIEDGCNEPPLAQIIPEDLHTLFDNKVRGQTMGVQLFFEIKHYDGIGDTLLVRIPRNPSLIATTSDGKIYLRVGDQSTPIHGDEIPLLMEEKGCFKWETQLSEYTIGDCDSNRISNLVNKLRHSDRVSKFIKEKEDKEILVHYALLDENSPKLTNLGVLFLGRQSQRSRISNAPTIQCIKYDEYGEKVNKWLFDDFNCSPDEIIDQIWSDIPEWRESQEVSDGMFRRNISAYDEDIIREIVCNSLVHRTYTIRGDIFLNIYPEYIECVSPGRLPLGVTPDNILHRSRKRNTHLADLMFALHYMEREGSGYDRMYEILLRNGKPIPTVKEGEDYVKARIDRRIHNQKILQLMDYADRNFNLRQKQIICLGLIALYESITARELEKLLEVDDSDALRPWLYKLLDLGLVVSSKVRSKGMVYQVNPRLLQQSKYMGPTTLKRIEDYRLRELILEDLRIYGEAQIGEIHTRIGKEIHRKRIKVQLEHLESDNVVGRRGSGRYTFYRLLSTNKNQNGR